MPLFECKLTDAANLTPLQHEDAAELFALTEANRERLRQWLPWLDRTKTVEDTRGFITMCLQQSADNKGMQCLIRLNGKIAGIAGFHVIDWNSRSVSIGYWIDEKAEGKGLITTAVKALVGYAFTGLELNRVEIRCATGNIKSQRIPERLGFQRDGVLRQVECLYGRYVDHVVFSMLRPEYRRPPSP